MSDIRTILVHLDGADRAPERLRLAYRLAATHGAVVRVLYASLPAIAAIPFPDEGGALIAQALMDIDDRRLRMARQAFDDTLAETGLRAEWDELEGTGTAGLFARQAMYADLLILGQHDPSMHLGGSAPADFVETVLGRCGRPAIVVPFTGPVPTACERVAIGWKETPEAARAVAAALPILARAGEVHVLSWSAAEAAAGKARGLPAFLRSHGIDSTWHEGGPEPDEIGEVLLSRVADLSADLLVTGCYGHSRSREWLLGGASRTLLSSMTVPVFMAH